VVPLNASGAAARLDLSGFVDRADRQPGLGGSRIQPGHSSPADHPIAAKVSHTARLSNRWDLSGARLSVLIQVKHDHVLTCAAADRVRRRTLARLIQGATGRRFRAVGYFRLVETMYDVRARV
jgi:hypothetical protein